MPVHGDSHITILHSVKINTIRKTNLVIAQSPFAIRLEIVSRGTPLLRVAIHGTAVIVLAFVDKWKYTAISGRIAAMCVHSAIALL